MSESLVSLEKVILALTRVELHENLLQRLSPGFRQELEKECQDLKTEASKKELEEFEDQQYADTIEDDTDTRDREKHSPGESKRDLVLIDDACSLDLLDCSKFVPVRLTYEERKVLRMTAGILQVSNYVDLCDNAVQALIQTKLKSNLHRVGQARSRRIASVLYGLLASQFENEVDSDFSKHAKDLREIFEIMRRYKILNPDRMRDAYGKLMYFLMDCVGTEAGHDVVDFSPVQPIASVYNLLTRNGTSNLQLTSDFLNDPQLQIATQEIYSFGRPRHEVQKDLRQKEQARKQLVKKYQNDSRRDKKAKFSIQDLLPFSFSKEREKETPDTLPWSAQDLEISIYSLNDHASYLRFNQEPCNRTLLYLERYFDNEDDEPSLAIYAGEGGARLTHSHQRQFLFAKQTLCLWREVLSHMFQIWALAEADMLDEENPYKLTDTGQGVQRLQKSPRVARSMSQILKRVQQRMGTWIGSSKVHLDDHNVPNALIFIDKYMQIPRILHPIVQCLEKLEGNRTNSLLDHYVEKLYGSRDACVKHILADFFRHAFDGSGGDNFFDAGSCVDGRLTSAWNWCSQIERKSYFPIFLLTGFVGFDGKF